MSTPTKIFIVDDNLATRQAMETLVRSLGYDTETFNSAEDCLVCSRIAEASCLITDVQMPGMSGFDLHSRLHAGGYRIPVIFISGNPRRPREVLLKAAIEAGAIGILDKPVGARRLIHYLEKALKATRKMRPW